MGGSVTSQIGPVLQELDSTLGLSDPPSPWADHITSQKLKEALERSAKRPMTSAEIAAQKASFVWGQLPDDNPMSKDEVAEHFTGFAPYTPVTVSSRTFPYQAPDRDGGSVSSKTVPITATEALAAREKAYEDISSLANEPTEKLLRREIETIRDLSDDGFNPFGSGPEPIGPRNIHSTPKFDH